jgi:arginyl-tRNA synthetase
MDKNNQSKKVAFYKDSSHNLLDPNDWDKAKVVETEISRTLSDVLRSWSSEIVDINVQLSIPTERTHGDFMTNVAYQLAGKVRRSPKEIATEIVSELEKSSELKKYVEKFEVAGGGFINFRLKKSIIVNLIEKTLLGINNQLGVLKGKRIMFEYGHPNPFKMIHIGHLRNFILGESLIRTLEYLGAEVIRTNYQGDVGMHVAKSVWGMKEKLKNENLNIEDVSKWDLDRRVVFIGEAYVLGASSYENDDVKKSEIQQINTAIYTVVQEELIKETNWNPKKKYSDFLTSEIDLPETKTLWELGKQWSLDEFHRIYEMLYSSFVREYMESETLYESDKTVEEAIEKGVLEKSEGAIVFKGERYGLDTRVFINSLGLPTYEGKELGLANLEFTDFGEIDLCIHNVATEQISFFKVTFKAEELLNPEKFAGKQYHNAYEFVGLKSGKMSSRKGSVVLAKDIINDAKEMLRPYLENREMPVDVKEDTLQKIAVGAIKYSFLNISAFKYLAFDLETSVNMEGNSGPYVMYTFARANKIGKDAGNASNEADLSVLTQKEEIELMRVLATFNTQVIETAKNLSPNTLCAFTYDLAQTFNVFYKQYPILNEKDVEIRNARIKLTSVTAKVLQKSLNLLGIKTVEKM